VEPKDPREEEPKDLDGVEDLENEDPDLEEVIDLENDGAEDLEGDLERSGKFDLFDL
jgi:hypothetical protein